MRIYCWVVWLLPASAFCQASHDWSSVQEVAAGERVRVVLSNAKPVTANFQAWSPEWLRVGAVQLPRTDIVRVEAWPGGGPAWKKALVMGVVVGCAGAAIGAAAGESCHEVAPGSTTCATRGNAAAAFGGIGFLVGGIVGAKLPAHGPSTVYSRPVP